MNNNLIFDLRDISWNFITNLSNVNDDYNPFIGIFYKNFKKSGPKQLIKIYDTYRDQPWVTKKVYLSDVELKILCILRLLMIS